VTDHSITPEAFLAMGRDVLASQPFSALIGAELAALAPGACELHVPIAENVRQQHGFVHGGVVSYAADNALTFAGGTSLRVPVVTSEFKINYLAPVSGGMLEADAQIVSLTRTTAVVRIEIRNESRTAGVAQGTVLIRDPR